MDCSNKESGKFDCPSNCDNDGIISRTYGLINIFSINLQMLLLFLTIILINK